ncbi:MAG: RluA family pseudouridine synthase, partial [Deltaproteobacteria bacterium]|nr:RluA family pseudouridine synthase [Deltaproteobacteria bacterium]
MEPDVRFLDNHLLVINKPAGMLAQSDKTGDTDLLSSAKQYLKTTFSKPGNVYLGLVHRLDRPVSGLMVFARTSKAAARLSEQFRRNTTIKRYLAIVEGTCTGHGTCRDHIIKENLRVSIVQADHPGALYAELSWQAAAMHSNSTLVEVTLKTGRPHQIRVQLAHMGFSILGDLRYGAQREFDGRNLALHSYHLGLCHPITKENMAWSAAPPTSWDGHYEAEISKLIIDVKGE